MKNRMFGMMNAMMGRKKFTKPWASILAEYKYHSESGIRVTEKTILPIQGSQIIENKEKLKINKRC
jgi:hypothetical protein